MISVTTGAIVAYVGGLALIAALILFLWQVVGITPWLSALIVGVVLAVGGYIMLRGALRELKRVDPKPERTARRIRGDIEWAKEQRP
jgi:uncharacterized membrane protein